MLSKKLKAVGYKIFEDKEEGGERITEIDIPKGEHLIGFGFRQINPTEKRWFHGGLDDKEKRETSSFRFDTNSLEFKKIKREFVSNLSATDNLDNLVSKLNIVIQRYIRSDMGEEYAHSLSEIIQTGKAACSSKSILAGTLLKEQFPDLRVEIIDGYLGKFEDKVSLPFGHEWLRISNGSSCVLYDPMYNKSFFYKFDTKPGPNNPFSRHTVRCLPFAKLYNSIKLTSISNSLKMIESYEKDERQSHDLVLSDECTVDSQLGGQIAAYIKTNGGILTLIDGNISNETETKNGPRILYPMIALEKVK